MAIEEFASNSRAPETLGNLPALLSWRSVSLLTGGEGTEGMLVFWGERLIAVLGRIDDRADRLGQARMWHLEIGFGECAAPPSGQMFQSLAQGLRWLAQCVQAGLGG